MKRFLSVLFVVTILLTFASQPIAAQEIGDPCLDSLSGILQPTMPQRRWSHLIRTDILYTIENDVAEFSALCYGSDSALYTVAVFFMNLDGELLAGPFFDGPRDHPFTGGSYTITEPGGYYVVAIFSSVVDDEVVESTMSESSVKYV